MLDLMEGDFDWIGLSDGASFLMTLLRTTTYHIRVVCLDGNILVHGILYKRNVGGESRVEIDTLSVLNLRKHVSYHLIEVSRHAGDSNRE